MFLSKEYVKQKLDSKNHGINNFYKPRLHKFKKSNFILDLETGNAYSYSWYLLGEIRNGVYVVNNYRYSRSTTDQRYTLERILMALGCKYIYISAPRGLQNRDEIFEYYLNSYATIIARGKDSISGAKALNDLKHVCKVYDIPIPSDSAVNLAILDAKEEYQREKEYASIIAALRRERKIFNKYSIALAENDLKTIIALRRQDENRVRRGYASLLTAFNKA